MKSDFRNCNIDAFPAPIFIMGCHRSGTTLLRQILNGHSRIAIYHETQYYPIFRKEVYYYGDLKRSANLKRFINDFREVIRVQAMDPGMEPPETNEFLEALVSPTFEGVLATLLHLYAKKNGRIRGGEKTPQHCDYLSEILESFHDSPVIFVIRDPRDTILSMRKEFGTSIEGGIKLWNDAFYSYHKSLTSVFLVRYEELVKKPEEIIKKICEYIGERYEDSMLRFFNRTPEQIIAQKGGKLLGPVDTSSVGKFHKMTTREIEQIEIGCAAGMQLMKYSFTQQHPKVIKSAEVLSPKRQNVFVFLIDRLRYYKWNLKRWHHGWMRWKRMIIVRSRYFLAWGSLKKNF